MRPSRGPHMCGPLGRAHAPAPGRHMRRPNNAYTVWVSPGCRTITRA
jgi:hypothetical protein